MAVHDLDATQNIPHRFTMLDHWLDGPGITIAAIQETLMVSDTPLCC